LVFQKGTATSRAYFRRSSFVVLSGCLLVLACFAVSAVVIPASSAVTGPVFQPAINLSSDSGKAIEPTVSNYGQNAYVAWTEGGGGIKFRASLDGGVTWQPTIKLSVGGGSTQFPVMFTQYQNTSDVLVAWAQEGQIWAAASSNNGTTFVTSHLSVSPSSQGITPAVAGWGSNLYVSWYQSSANCPVTLYVPKDSGCIWVSESSNNGTSWGSPVELNPSSRGEEEIVASGSSSYITADGIYFEATYDNGASWTAPVSLFDSYKLATPCTPVCYGREPWIAANGSNVYVTWESSNPNQTSGSGTSYHDYGRTSNDSGLTWNPPLSDPLPQLQTGSVSNAWEPENVAFGRNAFMTFHSLANQGLYVTSTQSNGTSWSAPVLVSSTGLTSAFSHTFTSDGENVFVMWGQETSHGSSTWNAYISYSPDAGRNWTAPIDISNNHSGVAAGNQDVTLFALSSNGIHCFAAWTYTSGSTSQIYFAHS
jgi:hypothetical protein